MPRNSRALPDAQALLSPAAVRIIPFAIYMAFLVAESILPAAHAQWLYPAQVGTTAAALALFWPHYDELHRFEDRARIALLGVAAGLLVFALWHAFDRPWAAIGEARPIRTAAALWSGDRSLALVRLVGVVVLVPIMEELFWRSFLMRWIAASKDGRPFFAIAPAAVGTPALLGAAALFAAEHHLVLAGLAAGLVYGELYRRTGALWPVIAAHALTNLLLEVRPALH